MTLGSPESQREANASGRVIGTHLVYGIALDPMSRCEHYHGETDIVAIRMACCNRYFACIHCHNVLAEHPAEPWESEANHTFAVLCGSCGTELTVAEYVACDSHCPSCGREFNPRCRNHWHFYFTRTEML